MPTQEEINEGQMDINGQLCRVDWRLIRALREVETAFQGLGANTRQLSAVISEAESISEKVADIVPPGCRPRDPKG